MSFDSEIAKAINNAQTNLNTTNQSHVDPCLHMFVPNRLHITGHPAIDVLPRDIVFAKSKVQNGKVVTGAALYIPDLSHCFAGHEADSDYISEYAGQFMGCCH